MIYKVAKLRGRVTYKITSIILHIYIYIYIWNIHKYVYCTIKKGKQAIRRTDINLSTWFLYSALLQEYRAYLSWQHTFSLVCGIGSP